MDTNFVTLPRTMFTFLTASLRCQGRWMPLLSVLGLATMLYVYVCLPSASRMMLKEGDEMAAVATWRRAADGGSRRALLVTVSEGGSSCVRRVRDLPILPPSAVPSQNYFIPGLKTPCWLQLLTPKDIRVMRSNFYSSKRLYIRARAYEKAFNNTPSPVWLRCLPYFYLIGAPKSATTDLSVRIGGHPGVQMVAGAHWWTRRRFGKGVQRAVNGTSETIQVSPVSFEEYVNILEPLLPKLTDTQHCDQRSNQPWVPNSRVVAGEKSPSYLFDGFKHHQALLRENSSDIFPPLGETVAAELAALHPGARVIAILREPGARLFSGHLYFHDGQKKSAREFHDTVNKTIHIWRDCVRKHGETFCADDPITTELLENARLYVGMYALHLRSWLNAFPRGQLLVLRTEDYARDVNKTMLRVFRHLDLEPPSAAALNQMAAQQRLNQRRRKTKEVQMLPETRDMLTDFYRPYNRRLARLLRSDKFLWKDVGT